MKEIMKEMIKKILTVLYDLKTDEFYFESYGTGLIQGLMDSAVEEELKKFMTWVIKEADIEVVGVNAIEVGKLSGTMATPVLTMDKFIKYYLSLPQTPKNKEE